MRDASRWILRLAACIAFAGTTLVAVSAPAAAQSRPNVVLIILDDMNDWVGALDGHPQTRTPRIDALAAEGTLFTNAHAGAPLCNPARVSFMTGITPARSGVTINKHQPWRNHLPKAVSLNQAFRDAGYHTVGFGKIYHGGTTNHDMANWDSYTPKPSSASPPADEIPINGFDEITRGGPGGGDWGMVDAPPSAFEDYKVATWAANFLNNRDPNSTEPFFLAVGLRSTHSPWYFPPGYFSRIAGGNTGNIVLPPRISNDLDDVGAQALRWAAPTVWQPLVSDPAAVRWAIHSYLAGAAFADDQVGRVLDALEGRGLSDNTIVVFLSDHGYHLSEKQSWQKQLLWEEDTHVPLVFRVPTSLVSASAGQVDTPVSISALFPTLLELAGIPAPNYAANDPRYRIDYRSLVPLLDAGVADNWEGPAVTFGRGDDATLRSSDWRFTLYQEGYVELYDRLADPNEWFNLANSGQYASLVSDLRSDARRYLDGDHAPFGFHDNGGGSGGGGGTIGDFVWRDTDGDGIQDAAEAGWASVAVSLHDCNGPAITTTTTDGTGKYQFSGLGPGSYQVAVALPAGASFGPKAAGSDTERNSDVHPNTGKSWCTSITSAGENRTTLDASLIPSGGSGGGRIGDFVWRDADGDGIQDAAEAGWPGVLLSLRECSGPVLSRTTTDSAGMYRFIGLDAGSYQVEVELPPGASFSPKGAGSDGNRNSDVRPHLGTTWCANITSAGEDRSTMDAGLVP